MAAYPTKKQKVPHLIFMTNAYPTVLCAKIRQKTVKTAKIPSQLLMVPLVAVIMVVSLNEVLLISIEGRRSRIARQ